MLAAQPADTWFSDTPLRHTYQALVEHQPELAWQELVLALSQYELNEQYWVPAKQAILNQTECGQKLTMHASNVPTGAHIELSIVRSFGLSTQSYQIKLSAQENLAPEDQTNTNKAASYPIVLRSPQGKVLLDAQFQLKKQYQEFEVKDMLLTPSSGIYQLKLNNHTIPLIISNVDDDRWLTLENKLSAPHIRVNLPPHVETCSPANVSWQWFDINYEQLGAKIPFTHNDMPVPKSSPYPEEAKHLSATAALSEYQQGIIINYIQRVAIPYSEQ
ncbi:DUF2861 domain-containing protein [Photobacterium jeanii]|nr:DUF2861 domain-containing protein [Photobacterium jeanii]